MQNSGSFDRFTERARKVLTLAQEETQLFNHNYIGPEHILLALIREGEGVAAHVLGTFGVELAAARSRVEEITGKGDREVHGDIGLTPTAKKVIEFSVDEARCLGHHYIGTEHLLLGLIRVWEGMAQEVLEPWGVTTEKARAEVIRVLTQTGSPPEDGVPRAGPLPYRPRRTPPVSVDPPDLAGYTDEGRKIIALAEEEAQRFQHNYIGTEHLLLGLLRDSEGTAADILDSLGIGLTKVRNAVEFIIGRGERQVMGGIGLTPRAKKVMELARDEARRLGHGVAGTEHILLGLIREGEGIAAGVLESLGVSLEKVRVQVIRVLAERGDPQPAPAGTEPWAYLGVLVQPQETSSGEHAFVCSRLLFGEAPPQEITGMSVQDALPLLGAEGWELAGIDPACRAEGSPASLYIFKRRRQ